MHSPRVLVVEDDPLIAIELTDILEEEGCEVVGSPGSVAAALDLLRNRKIDLALLDVALGAETVEPVAKALTRRAIPFGVVTAYPPAILPDAVRGHPLVQKPFAPREIRELAEHLCASVPAVL
jgi:CheY-like chemotaxis protein